MTTPCPLCGGDTFEPLLRLNGLPCEEGRFATTAAEAADIGVDSIALHHCTTCGLIHDVAPRTHVVTYEPGYSTFMGHSPSFAAHVVETARRLVARHGLAGGRVVDVACGFGDFLQALLAEGMAAGVGIDPAAAEQSDPRLRVVREYFSPALLPDDVDLVSCRHLLYYVDDPTGFLRELRSALEGRDTVVYLELVNRGPGLAEADPWDSTVEHRTYFTEESAWRMLTVAGFEVLDIRPVHHDRFIAVEARPIRSGAVDPAWTSSLTGALAGLQGRADARITGWREALTAARTTDGTIVAWCAGARAIAFLALAGAGSEVTAVVDLSPARQGRFVPGSALPVVGPAAVAELAPQAVLVTNSAYTGEIIQELAERGLSDVPVVELDDPDAPGTIVAIARRARPVGATPRP